MHGYVRAGEAEAYKKEIEGLRAQTDQQVRTAQEQAAEQVNKFRADYQAKLQFDYTLDSKAARAPFLVSAIYHDDAFTYIKCAAREKPALYEMKDGKPNISSTSNSRTASTSPPKSSTPDIWLSAKRNSHFPGRFPRIERRAMNEPIQEKTPKPPGLVPKNVQSWLLIGLALLMVMIMWLTGGKKPQSRRSKTPAHS